MVDNKIKKVVIFAGGKGTRMSEFTHKIPKPLVEIGGEPILIHIMRHFYRHGYKEFIIAAGYKSDEIKRYFRDYHLIGRNVTFTKNNINIDCSTGNKEDWIVHIVETGEDSGTAKRLYLLKDYIGEEDFFLTYGDSFSDVPVTEIEKEHYKSINEGHDRLATITAVTKGEKFGILEIGNSGVVTNFQEKALSKKQYINGGFIACSNSILNEVSDSSGDFSFEVLTDLAKENKLGSYIYEGFWKAVDSKRDKDNLEKIFHESPELFK